MSSRLKLPPCRKFPKRISQEELKARTTEVMKEKGANYHFQAQYYEATSHEVVGLKDPKLTSLQSSPKVKKDEAWQIAYDFLFDFLQKNEMELTLSTINVEFNKKKVANNHHFDKQSRDQYFNDLLQTSRLIKTRGFEKQVDEFAQKEGIED